MAVRRVPEPPPTVFQPSAPATPVNGTIWVDSDSDVPVVNPSDYVVKALITASNQLISSSGAGTPVAVAIENDQSIISAQVFG